MADDTKTLDRGQTTIRARDTSPDSITIEATDTVVTTVSRSFQRISAACPTQEYRNTDPSEAPFDQARQFFAVRDSVDSVDENFANYPAPRVSVPNAISGYLNPTIPVGVDPLLWLWSTEGLTSTDTEIDAWATRSTSGLTFTEGGTGKPVRIEDRVNMNNALVQENFFLCGDTTTFQDITGTGIFSMGWRGTFDAYDVPVFTVDASLFHTRGSTGRGANLFVSAAGSTLSFVTWNGGGTITHRCDWTGFGAFYTLGEIVDIVVIGDGVNMRMYVDGVEVGTTGTVIADPGPHALTANFGKLNNGNLFHIGSIEGVWYDDTATYGFADVDDIRTFMTPVISDQELLVVLQDDFFLQASESLEADGTPVSSAITTSRLSSFAASQEIPASRPILRTEVIPYGNSVFDFEGTDFYRILNSTLNPLVPVEDDFTLEVVVRMDSLAGTQAVFSQWVSTPGNGSFRLSYQGGFRVDLISDGVQPDASLTTSTGVVVGELYSVVVTRSGNTFNLYLNGVLEDTVTDAGSRVLGSFGALLGANDASGVSLGGAPTNFLDGQIAEVSVTQGAANNILRVQDRFERIYGRSVRVSVRFDENVVNFVDTTISPWLTTANNVNEVGELTGRSSPSQLSTSTFYRPTYTENALNGRSVLTFDGNGDYFEWSGVTEPIGSANGNLTITTLVNPTANTSARYFNAFNTSSGGNTFLVGYRSSRFELFDETSSTTYTSTNTFAGGQFYVVTLVHEGAGTAARVYVNGVLEIDQVINTQVSTTDRYLLGAELDGNSPSNYYLGQIAFHAVAASSSPYYRTLFESYAIGAYYDPENLPDAFAVFEADTPGVAYVNSDPVTAWNDLTANANNAVQGTPANQPEYVTNVVNGLPAIRFTGANSDELVIPSAVSNGASDELTVVAFASNTSGGTGTLVTTEGASANQGFSLGYEGSGDLEYEHGGQTPVLTEMFGATTPRAVGGRRDGNDADVELEAKFSSDTTLTGFTPTTDLNTRIGGSANRPYLTGDIHELALYTRRLNDYEARGISYGYNLKYGTYELAKPVLPNEVFEFDVLLETGYSDGDPVPSLTDQTGTADATSASLQGEYRANLIAGLPTVYFDGSTVYTSPTVPNIGAGVRTIFYVGCHFRNGGTDAVAFSYGPAAGEDFAFFVQNDAGNGNTFVWQFSNNITVFPGVFKPTRTLEVIAITYDGSIHRMYQNGVLQTEQAIALNTGSEGITIGDQNLGGSTANRFDGWISYLNFANTAYTEEEVLLFSEYLARRFRIPL